MFEKIFQWRLSRIKKRGERYKRKKEIEDAYAEYLPERKKRKVSNIMLVVIVIAIMGYVIANFWLQSRTSIEVSPTLTTCYFAFWTGEILTLAGIKCSKIFKEKHDNQYYEE